MELTGWAVAGLLFVLLIFRDAARDLVKRLVNAGVAALERRFSGSRWVRARALRRYRRTVYERLASVPVPFELPVDIPMRDVYIPLRAADQPDATPVDDPVDLAAAVMERRRVLVLGPPGSGKSLFLRFLLWSSCAPPSPDGSSSGQSGRRKELRARGGGSLGRVGRRQRTDRTIRPRRHRRASGMWGRDEVAGAPLGQPLPVAVPLSRLGDSANLDDVEAEIVESFGRDGFANAGELVRRELRRDLSNLLVLFDGLDEVASPKRPAVAKLLAELAERHPSVRFVVTCRTQVYGGALDGVVDKTFHVQPFTDELVERFLHAWPPMSSREAVDRLVTALGNTPRVAVLVRNPLLLTMLAYLYSDQYRESTSMLPHNRAQFYRDASELLLRRWPERRVTTAGAVGHRYDWLEKKVVLQHLALVNQDSRSDRRGMRYEDVLTEIRAVLPRVDIAAGEAPAVLREIVEGSGLLMALDGGERYQFAHLTMQEYFAAIELHDRPDEILHRYEADPDAWREPVKLWCGGEHDATQVIRAIWDLGADALAIECLADATRVDERFADALVDHVKALVAGPGKGTAPDEQMTHAIGLLAADRRPRGRAVFDHLVEAMTSAEAPARRRAAAALAASNLPEAAEALAANAEPFDDVFADLERMGNVAVPALTRLVEPYGVLRPETGYVPTMAEAVTALTRIGTPRAAQALAGFLWHTRPGIPTRAAVGLAQLSSSPAVEDALAAVGPPSDVMAAPNLPTDWVWTPFVADRPEPGRRRLLRIFGRCRALLEDLTDDDFATIDRELDPRLVIAMLLYEEYGTVRSVIAPVSEPVVTFSVHDDSLSVVTVHEARPGAGVAWAHVWFVPGDPDPASPVRTVRNPMKMDSSSRPVDGSKNDPAFRDDEGPWWHARRRAEPMPEFRKALVGLAALFKVDRRVVRERRSDPSMRHQDVYVRLVDNLQRWGLPRVRDWLMLQDGTSPFNVDGSLYHRIPLIGVLLVALGSTPFAWQGVGEASGWGRLPHGLLLVSLMGGISLLVADWLFARDDDLSLWNRVEEAVGLAIISPAWTEDHLRGRSRSTARTFVILASFGFTPSWLYGLAVWLHPPGLGWAIGAVGGFSALAYGLLAIGRAKEDEPVNPLRGAFTSSTSQAE